MEVKAKWNERKDKKEDKEKEQKKERGEENKKQNVIKTKVCPDHLHAPISFEKYITIII